MKAILYISGFLFIIGIFCTGCGSGKPVVTASPYEEKVTDSVQKSPVSMEAGEEITESPSVPIPPEKDSIQTNRIVDLHEKWDSLLQKHVKPNGFVSYEGFKKDRKKLEEYLSGLSHNVPDTSATKNEKLAYWINVYNAFTIELILDHYPVASIKDIKNPWDEEFFKLGGTAYSLNDVEHKILRTMKEPRIHFAIVCASVSCPKLLNEAFRPEQLETQLEMATKHFLNNPEKNKIAENNLELSLIFRWFSKDFKSFGAIESFIQPYVDVTITARPKISYLKYDWGLNGR